MFEYFEYLFFFQILTNEALTGGQLIGIIGMLKNGDQRKKMVNLFPPLIH